MRDSKINTFYGYNATNESHFGDAKIKVMQNFTHQS